MIAAIDQHDIHRRPPQGARRIQPAEPAANYDHAMHRRGSQAP